MIDNKRTHITSKILINAFFILLSIGFIVPLIAIISISFSSDTDIIKYGYRLFPAHFSTMGYDYILKNPMLVLTSYKVTFIMSAVGTVTYLIMVSMCAYPLSRLDFKYRSSITFYLFFTMLFNGGLVPWYILMTRYLNLKDTYLALILPLLGNVWYIFLMRTFFQQLPKSIIESAVIDGANEFQIYLKIIIPLSKPVLATVGLFQLLACWNSWYNALLFIDDQKLYPLQYLLQMMLQNMNALLAAAQSGRGVIDYKMLANLPTESMRMAMCILAIGPILLIFPFFQKYFTKGLTVGSIKG